MLGRGVLRRVGDFAARERRVRVDAQVAGFVLFREEEFVAARVRHDGWLLEGESRECGGDGCGDGSRCQLPRLSIDSFLMKRIGVGCKNAK